MHAMSLSTSVSLAGQPGLENSAVTNPASSLSDAMQACSMMQVQASRQLLSEDAWNHRRSHDSACKTTVRIVQCTVELRLAP